jgi:DNA-binding response OmpR family regulator
MAQRVLIVEDDPSITNLLTAILSGIGFEVVTTDSAFGGAAFVRDIQPCAIVLDVALPYRRGTELLDELKDDARTVSVPVVVLSAFAESLTAERRALASAVLGKPFDIKKLVDVLLQLCQDRS